MLVFLGWGKLLSAAPTSDVFTENNFLEEDTGVYYSSMTNFQADIYCADQGGRVYKFVVPAEQCDGDGNGKLVVIAQVSPDVDVSTLVDHSGLCSYLVESAGELLLVRCADQSSLKVFRVNIELKTLEEIKSLDSHRALFLGERCLSVYADKLASVDGGCIYMLDYEYMRDMCVYNLRGDMVDYFSKETYLDQPFSLVHLLLWYCDVCQKW